MVSRTRIVPKYTWSMFAAYVLCAFPLAVTAQPVSSADPVLATYDGGIVTLRGLEEFMREVPMNQRIPAIDSAGEWRKFACRELAKNVVFTTRAVNIGLHFDPGYLRAREYFLQEYLDYQVLRDHVNNRMDVSLEAQKREYETNREDFRLSPTVSLRYLRVKSRDVATSAASRIAGGEDFVKVETEVSEVSPRYVGRVLGPFPGAEARTGIPPPPQVLDAAMQTDAGQTTGPIQVGPNYFILRTESKTAGGVSPLEDVAEKVEIRLRNREGMRLIQGLINQFYKELDVKVDEALFTRTPTRPDDVLATVGATRITRQEYDDLNGRVRGPALNVAQMQPTKLRQFITPVILAEVGKIRGYPERTETRKALQYYDLQNLSNRLIEKEALLRVKEPTDRELRGRFAAHYNELRQKSGGDKPTFEMWRENLREAAVLGRKPEAIAQVVEEALTGAHFKLNVPVSTTRMTALEAAVLASKQLPEGSRLLQISEARYHGDRGTPAIDIGRNTSWRISYTGAGGSSSEIFIEGLAELNDGSPEFTSCSLYAPLHTLWKFDTDSLMRHAIDNGLADFYAKHHDKLNVVSALEFAYDSEDVTSATDCVITYRATPVDESVPDGLILRYSGRTGEITRRRVGEPEGPCPTCPGPDLPAVVLRDEKTTTTSTVAK